MSDTVATEDLLARVEEGGVAVLTMNRPDALNALTRPMMRAMWDALETYGADPEVGCIVLTGAGRGFCAGGDVKAMASGEKNLGTFEAKAQDLRARMDIVRLLHQGPKPTIAMVNGVAAGAGLGLALACDIRVAAASARMTTAFAKVGLSGDFGGTWFLNRLVGPARARELYFTSEILDAARIEALGLANRVVPDEQLEAETMALARRIAGGPRVALTYMKRNANVAETGTLSDLLDAEALHMTRCRDTEDHREAARAFVEKRAPAFRGR
jgi:2-(1,2-epoxy-1,2-dihydrophenyl)acetyl-CoA isomerase